MESCCVAQASLKLAVLQPQPPRCWEYGNVNPTWLPVMCVCVCVRGRGAHVDVTGQLWKSILTFYLEEAVFGIRINKSHELGMWLSGWVLIKLAQGSGFNPSGLKKEAKYNRVDCSELVLIRFVALIVLAKVIF